MMNVTEGLMWLRGVEENIEELQRLGARCEMAKESADLKLLRQALPGLSDEALVRCLRK